MRCTDFLESLVSLAEGRFDAEASRHVGECAACASRLAEFERIVLAWRLSQEHAPSGLVVQAKGFVSGRRRLVARLLGNGLAAAGARRGGARDFALYVGVEDFSMHLHYSPLPDGWEVMGRAPTPGWSVAHEGGEIPCGTSGRFRLLAPSLDGTKCVLRKDGAEIEIPSARELTDIGP